MALSLAGVENGMDVYDSMGEKIGSVADVLSLSAYSQNAQADPYAGGTDGTVGSAGEADQNTVLKVSEGGVLGIGATNLYIPVDAVQSIAPNQSVTLNCAKAQCESLYAQKPTFLDNV